MIKQSVSKHLISFILENKDLNKDIMCNFSPLSCNSYAKPSTPVKIAVAGGDTLMGWVVRPYVELLSSRPSEWLNFTRIFFIPVGICGLAKQLASLDQGYATLFPPDQDLKIDEIATRGLRYLAVPPTAPLAQLPVGEAMLTCQDDSSQLFIPFVNVSCSFWGNFRFINEISGGESGPCGSDSVDVSGSGRFDVC